MKKTTTKLLLLFWFVAIAPISVMAQSTSKSFDGNYELKYLGGAGRGCGSNDRQIIIKNSHFGWTSSAGGSDRTDDVAVSADGSFNTALAGGPITGKIVGSNFTAIRQSGACVFRFEGKKIG